MRTEHDFLGELQLPDNALYGIHSLRAKENFPDTTPFHKEWYQAMGQVKLACYNTYEKFRQAALERFSEQEIPVQFISDDITKSLAHAARQVAKAQHFDQFIIPAVQGGAGTSINMNVNEIISNLALQQLDDQPGNYERVDPFEHANVYQSTNDVVPTALKVATIRLLEELEEAINNLRFQVEKTESKYRNVLRQAYTQLQAAVPSTYDRLFSTYNNALSRDWWRVSKCFERIKEVNLGGGAIGTGLSIPRYFLMHVVTELQHLTGFPITRSENLCDTTANLDSLVEVHAILKAHAVNLEKMVNDLRLLGSDFSRYQEVIIPQQQVGSSIMPGKVNPVIPEYVISVAHKVYSNDVLISNLCGQGCLDLNAYLPMIGHALLDSLKLLISANQTLLNKLFIGLSIQKKSNGNQHEYSNPAVVTAVTPYIGYHKAAGLARFMKQNNATVFEANQELNLIPAERLQALMKPESLVQQGYSLNDLKSKD